MKASHHLKHWLIPHRKNHHHPHLIRRHGLALMAVLILAVQGAAYAVQPSETRGQVLAYASDITVNELFTQTNQQRAVAGLPALRLDARLDHSATLKAQNMFAEDYWAHVSPSGIQPWYWFQQAGYMYQTAGENLAKDFDTTSGAMAGWMNSPGHRANILNTTYTDVGFAVVNGTLQGEQTTLVVAHYGSQATPAVAAATAPPAPATPAPAPAKSTPVPTTVITPAPTPAVTPAPSPTVTPIPPVAKGQITAAPPGQSYTLWRPLAYTQTLSWSNFITTLLLLLLLAVYTAAHFIAWRRQLRRWRKHHYRFTSALQVGVLALAILALAASSLGQVG